VLDEHRPPGDVDDDASDPFRAVGCEEQGRLGDVFGWCLGTGSGGFRAATPGRRQGSRFVVSFPASNSLWLGGQRAAGVAGVDGADRFDQQDCRLLVGARAVLDIAGDDEEFALVELDVAVAELDGEVSLEHEEEIVAVVVLPRYVENRYRRSSMR
jgi:hypothetical protein